MISNTYEPFTTMFLLPDELKARYTTLKDLVKDRSLLSGDFKLQKPESPMGFKTELQRMRMAAQSQTSFVNAMFMSKKLEEIKADKELNSVLSGDVKKRRGRPLKLEKRLRQQRNLYTALAKRVMSHDANFAIKFINSEASQKMHTEENEYKNMLGKRTFNAQTFFEEEISTLSELAKVGKKIAKKSQECLKVVKKTSKATSMTMPMAEEKNVQVKMVTKDDDTFSISNESSYSPRSESVFSSLIDTENTPSYEESMNSDFDFEFEPLEPEQDDSLEFVTKKLKSQYFVGNELFGTFESIGKSYADSAVMAIAQVENTGTCTDDIFEFSAMGDENITQKKNKDASISTRRADDMLTSFAQTDGPVMKDVGTTNVCEMIDFGNDKPSVDQETSDDIDYIENSLISPSQSPKRRSNSKSIDELFLNDISMQTSPLNDVLVGDKFTQVDL